jgi:hypothetical protein
MAKAKSTKGQTTIYDEVAAKYLFNLLNWNSSLNLHTPKEYYTLILWPWYWIYSSLKTVHRVHLNDRLIIRAKTDRQHNDQKCEDTKGVICSPNRRRTDNITTKSVKIPKGLSVVRIEMLSVRLRFGLQIIPLVSSHFWSLCCLSIFDSDYR